MQTVAQLPAPSLRASLLATALLFAACSGGGGGSGSTGPGTPGPRLAGTAVFLTEDHLRLMGVADDGSLPAVELSKAPFTAIQQFGVSPDGAAVAWIADADATDRFDLYVRPLAAAAPTRVSMLQNGFADVLDFAWAPDGKSLAYRADDVVDDRADLHRAAADGSGSQLVFASGQNTVAVAEQYAWSPDGNQLAWLLLDNGESRHLQLAETWAGGRTTAILDVAPGRQVRDLAFSPDSRWLSMRTDDRAQPGQFEVFCARTDLSAPVRRANGTVSSSVQIGDYAWSHDSRFLAQQVLGFPNGGSKVGINTYAIDTSVSRRVVTTSSFGVMAWAPDTARLAMVADFVPGSGPTGAMQLLVHDADADTLDVRSHALAAGEALRGDLFAWSPDGARIAYVSVTGAFAEQTWLAELAGGTPPAATTGGLGYRIATLAWSPDGKQLGLLEHDITAAFHPGRWQLVGTDAVARWSSAMVNTYDSSQTLRWSHDGVRAVYSVAASGSGADQLLTVAADGSKAGNLTALAADPAQVFRCARGALPR